MSEKEPVIHFIKMEGANQKTLDDMADQIAEYDLSKETNIMVTDQYTQPMTREEVKCYLDQMADALGMELVEK